MPNRIESKKSFCRLCHVFCGITVDIASGRGRVVAVRGDPENPFSRGYTCPKGRAVPEDIHHPERLLTCRRRVGSAWSDLACEQALDEIALQLRHIAERHGPRSVAAYVGTGAAFSAAGWRMAKAWLDALGSPSLYTPLTVDKPGIIVAAQRFFGSAATPLGTYAGVFDMDHAEVALFIGTNPLVSHGVGMPNSYPAKRLRDARSRGMKLIVIDPRRSETAKRADLHLPVRPGEDATLLAGMIKVILEANLHDHAYVQAFVSGLDQLREAVRDFDLAYVSRRTGVAAESVARAATLFASARTGAARLGVGLAMSRHQNLTIHLVHTLNALCGRIDRKGGLLFNPGVLSRPIPSNQRPAAQPLRADVKARVRGLSGLLVAPGYVEMPSATLADEILTPGDGRVRALVVLKGNPLLAFPDLEKTAAALHDLELLVVIDTFMTATAEFAHYVLPTKHFLERPDMTLMFDRFYPAPFAQYTPAVVPAPGSLLEDWEILWELARRMGLSPSLPGLSAERRPTSDEVLNVLAAGSRIALDEVRRHPSGCIFGEVVADTVLPGGIAHPNGKMAAGHPDVIAELREVRAEPVILSGGYDESDRFTHRLISMRVLEIYNTKGREIPALRRRQCEGTAYLHPDDLRALQLADGGRAVIDSGHGRLYIAIAGDPDIRPGVVAIPFGLDTPWPLPHFSKQSAERSGSSLAQLIPNDRRFDPITGMALQTAIPVNIYPAPHESAAAQGPRLTGPRAHQ
ncbi:MAG: hypothetical protein H6Q33_1064 [Deltaproteobacteria bacterium]|nr:hypothetical protein [Deltaproteobacteria bacterium]